ncbi:hypothetical protein BD779DRAFT_1468315 [Infundibulicybe gibba]|nr:hypothetical protein BD779DRAFT_1468315 [Infundibulicybe gibba]
MYMPQLGVDSRCEFIDECGNPDRQLSLLWVLRPHIFGKHSPAATVTHGISIACVLRFENLSQTNPPACFLTPTPEVIPLLHDSMFTTLLKIALLPALVAAQDYGGPAPGPTSTAPTPAPTAPADTPGHMNIDVAFNNSFVFHPASIMAPVGTIVTFWFPNNGLAHSVTQSSFANPCTYLAASANDSAGFDSGLQTNVQFSVNITDASKPIWFHCKQVTHCGIGMVGSINAPTDGNNTFAAFQNAAIAIGNNEVTETDNGPVLGGEGGANAAAKPASGAGTSDSIKIAANAAAIMMGVMAIVFCA